MKSDMKLIGITGTRAFGNDFKQQVGQKVSKLFQLLSKDHHIAVGCGNTTGADYWVKQLCNVKKIGYLEAVAFWGRPDGGKSNDGGLRRASTLAAVCDRVFLFWDGKSPGTRNCMEECQKLGTPYWVITV